MPASEPPHEIQPGPGCWLLCRASGPHLVAVSKVVGQHRRAGPGMKKEKTAGRGAGGNSWLPSMSTAQAWLLLLASQAASSPALLRCSDVLPVRVCRLSPGRQNYFCTKIFNVVLKLFLHFLSISI